MTELRQATASDIEVVRRISADAYLPYEASIGFVPIPAVEDYGPRIERGDVWLLEVGGEVVGVAVLERKPDHLLIYSIAVPPDRQRKGYGRALLDFTFRHAVQLGVGEVRLFTNQRMERNIALYARCGFVQTGTRPHPTRAGNVLVDMVKTLWEHSR